MPKKQTDSKDAKGAKKPAPKKRDSELSEKDLNGVAGGMIAQTGFGEDDDIRLP